VVAFNKLTGANELIELNRPEEWKREVERALELDPLNDFLARLHSDPRFQDLMRRLKLPMLRGKTF
jgi:hypothetical protein